MKPFNFEHEVRAKVYNLRLESRIAFWQQPLLKNLWQRLGFKPAKPKP